MEACAAVGCLLQRIDEIKQRYPFFVLEGQTKTAKTSWAAARLGDTRKVFYVNCASGNEPDLRKFDYFQHKIILYDEAPPNMVIQQKLLFQAPPVWVKLGQLGVELEASCSQDGPRLELDGYFWKPLGPSFPIRAQAQGSRSVGGLWP